MSAIAHGQNYNDDLTTSSSTSFVDILREDATSFVATGKYLLVVTMGIGADNDSADQEFQVVHGSGDTVFPGSLCVVMPWDTVVYRNHDYSFMTVFTQPGTAEDVAVQFRSPGGDTVRVQDAVLTWIRLDDDLTEDTDWFFGELNQEGGGETELPTSYGTEYAYITFTPDNNNDDWLVLSTFRAGTWSTSRNYNARLNRDDTDLTPEYSQEGETNAGRPVHVIARTYQLSNSSHTFRLQALEEAGSANHEHHYSNVFALRLSAFEDSESVYTEGTATRMPADARREVAGITPFTPQTAGDFWIYGSYVSDMDALARDLINIQVGGSTVPSGYDDSGQYRGLGFDSTDEIIKAHHCIESFAASSQDIDLDAEASGGSGGNWQHRFLVAFSMELVPSGTTHDGDASITASGAVGADASLIANGTATLSGVGTSTADASMILGADASIAGSCTVAADGKLLVGGSAAISATGSVGADGKVVKPGSANISGIATVGADASAILDGAGAISITGTVIADGKRIVGATADCSGTAAVGAFAGVIFDDSAAISGTGTVAASADIVKSGEATISGTGTVVAGGIVIFGGSASISATGTVVADGIVILDAAASIGGTGTVGAQGNVIFDTSAAIGGIGTVGAAGTVGLFGAASISGTGAVTADASVVFDADAAIAGTGTVTADGSVIFDGDAAINGTGTVTAAGTVITAAVVGSATISGIGTITADGNLILGGNATLAGIGSVGADGSGIFDGAATISGVGTLTASAAEAEIELVGGIILPEAIDIQLERLLMEDEEIIVIES